MRQFLEAMQKMAEDRCLKRIVKRPKLATAGPNTNFRLDLCICAYIAFLDASRVYDGAHQLDLDYIRNTDARHHAKSERFDKLRAYKAMKMAREEREREVENG